MDKELRRLVAQVAKNAGLDDDCQVHIARTVTLSAAVAWQDNHSNGRRGLVQCFRYLVGGKAERGGLCCNIPQINGFVSVYVAKGLGEIGNQLSPFFLTVPPALLIGMTVDGSARGKSLISAGSVSVPLELWWQSAKVCVDEVAGEHQLPTPEYFARRAEIYNQGIARRRYVHSAIAGAWFGDGLEPWVKSRVWYCVAYEQSAGMTGAFTFLETLVSLGVNVLLLGPDGFPMEEGVDAAYVSEDYPFGHERVLASMLMGSRPWAGAVRQQHATQPRPSSLVQLAECPPYNPEDAKRASTFRQEPTETLRSPCPPNRWQRKRGGGRGAHEITETPVSVAIQEIVENPSEVKDEI